MAEAGCSLRRLQRAIARAYTARDEARGLHATLLWLVEEVGELAEAVLKGDRGLAEEEIADIIAWTLSVAELLSIDAEEALKRKYGEVLGEVCGGQQATSS